MKTAAAMIISSSAVAASAVAVLIARPDAYETVILVLLLCALTGATRALTDRKD